MSSYFPNRWPLSYLNLTKNMKTYIRRQQHKNFKHKDIKQKEPPQKYRLGTISNTKLLAGLNRFYRYLTSPSASDSSYKTLNIKHEMRKLLAVYLFGTIMTRLHYLVSKLKYLIELIFFPRSFTLTEYVSIR